MRLDIVLIVLALCITVIYVAAVVLDSLFLSITAVTMSLVWLMLLAEWN